MNESDLLRIRDYRLFLKTETQTVPVISRGDLHIRPGEIVGLIGESGCGKTVLWKSIFGLLEPEKWVREGEAAFRGETLKADDAARLLQLRGKDAAVILQDPMSAFDQVFTIEHHFLETARAHTGWTRQATRERAVALLRQLYLREPEKVLAMYPFQCSGGMLQRVMIAIAILMDPAILIADEPTTAVDVTVQRQVIAMLRRLNQEQHTGILYISHDLRIVEDLAQRIYVMYAGALVESFPAQVLREGGAAHPYTRRLLASRPSFTKEKLPVMPGSPPALLERPAGCPFAPRCSEATAACADFGMERTDLGGGHWLRCCRAGGGV